MTSPLEYRVDALPQNRAQGFDVSYDAAQLAELAVELDIPEVRKLRFQGELYSIGKRDWGLKATLGATVVQTCVVTLDPVATRIDDTVERRFIAGLTDSDEEEAEMPEDVSADPLPDVIDLSTVIHEALSLALPPYPRGDTADTGEMVFTEPGKTAMLDKDTRPFAGLSDLLGKKD